MIHLQISPEIDGVIIVPKAKDTFWKSFNKKPKRKHYDNSKKRVTYKSYIVSKEWRKRRADFFDKYRKKCFICHSTSHIGLHHINYSRLGNEEDKDLIALCWFHHEAFHDNFGRGGKISNTTKKTIQFILDERESNLMRQIIKTL